MFDKLERICKEMVVPWMRYCHCICLEGLRKTTKSLSQGSRCPDINSRMSLVSYRYASLLGRFRYKSDNSKGHVFLRAPRRALIVAKMFRTDVVEETETRISFKPDTHPPPPPVFKTNCFRF
jgi:hypothetical protein